MRKFASTFFVLWIIWIALAGFNVMEIILGGVVSLILSSVIGKYVSYSFLGFFPIKIIKFIFVYIPLFIYKLVIANLDLARIVLSPSLPINPGFVKVKTDLKGDIGKLTLANSITLTPGTLSVDVKDSYIYVHWVNVKGNNEKEYKQEVCGAFEKVLGGIFK